MRFSDLDFKKPKDNIDKRIIYTAYNSDYMFDVFSEYGRKFIFVITEFKTGHKYYYKVGHIHGKFENMDQQKKRILYAFYSESLNDMHWED